VRFMWSFGDGVGSTQATPTHTYQEAGTYTVHLLLTFEDGSNVQAERRVTVGAGVDVESVVPNQVMTSQQMVALFGIFAFGLFGAVVYVDRARKKGRMNPLVIAGILVIVMIIAAYILTGGILNG
jgi:hypothetical protein